MTKTKPKKWPWPLAIRDRLVSLGSVGERSEGRVHRILGLGDTVDGRRQGGFVLLEGFELLLSWDGTYSF